MSDDGKHPNPQNPLVCTSTGNNIARNGTSNGARADDKPSCMPCTTEYDSDSTWVGIDSLSTYCITNDVNDYTEPPSAIRREVRGIQKDPAFITFVGKGSFRITEEGGATVELPVDKLYYCSSAPVKILSPQHLDKMFRKKNNKNYFRASVDSDGCNIQWAFNGKEHYKIITINGKTGVPLCKTAPGYSKIARYITNNTAILEDEEHMNLVMSAVNKQERNEQPLIQKYDLSIDDAKKEPIPLSFHDEKTTVDVDKDLSSMDPTSVMLYLHCKLGHIPFMTMRNMAKVGLLPKKIIKCREPKCSSCLFGAATRRAWRTKSPIKQIGRQYQITAPGDCTSVDQFESPVPGLVAQIKGIPTTARYTSGTVFVDHFTDTTFVHFQKSLTAAETIEAKEAYERWASSHGIVISHYHADNGRFAENAFVKHVQEHNQTIFFCGVNAHFQNGRAERKIRTLQDQARCQIIHAKMRWPQAISTHLWPYALRNVVEVMNDTCYKENKKTRIEVFSGADASPNLRHHHHFGVPTYVLENHLQSGFKIGKWLPRSRVGIYLGKSPRHARSVALVLNPRTGNVSPQFHVKFDDLFETVRGVNDDSHGIWKAKCGFTTEKPLRNNTAKDKTDKKGPLAGTEDAPSNFNESPTQLDYGEQSLQLGNELAHGNGLKMAEMGENGLEMPENDPFQNEAPARTTRAPREPTRRSSRAWKPSLKFLEGFGQDKIVLSTIDAEDEVLKYTVEHHTMVDQVNPMSLLAKTDQDTMYWDQAIKAPDSEHFIKAALDEVQTHEDNEHWISVPLTEVPEGVRILDCVWSMKRKRRLKTNEIYKHKARLNIHGGQQELGINYWETYAPVVTWAAIRLLLVLSIICGWYSVQIDFVLAYPQAPVECELFMRIPKGFTIQGGTRDTHCLKLLKNLYGQKQAGRVWNRHLHEILLELGWEQSKADDCVYYKNGVIFCVYVDDGILFSIYQERIDTCIQELQERFNISIEGDVSDYVGVNIEKKEDGTIHMTQPQLIKSIIKEMNFLDSTKPSTTPAYSSVTLSAGTNKPPHKADWLYRRVIGKLNFLEKSCRPEIACAVHQAARFAADPRTNHTDAVKKIVRYLKGNQDKGIIYKPNEHSFEVYADADFCGLWDHSIAEEDPVTAKSRTGYVVMYAGCPIIWASQLQPEIAQSVTESEYISLSQCLRQTIPLMRLVEELKEKLEIPMDTIPTVRCKLFEDNSGAVELANVPKMRPRTKHINTKYHHFRAFVAKGLIKVLKIGTEEQLADILTKNLKEELFLQIRKWICGW